MSGRTGDAAAPSEEGAAGPSGGLQRRDDAVLAESGRRVRLHALEVGAALLQKCRRNTCP